MSNITGIEQNRANYAYQCAEEGRDSEKNKLQIGRFNNHYFKDEKYKSYVRKIPMMIKTSGLGNTFAFVLSKMQKGKEQYLPGHSERPKNAYDLLYEQVDAWLKTDDKKYLLGGMERQELVKIFIQLDSARYRAVTVEVLALFNWLKRFADGLIKTAGNETENS